MYITKEDKEKIFKKHGKNAKDTGSAEGQIALFTERINHLTKHLKQNNPLTLIEISTTQEKSNILVDIEFYFQQPSTYYRFYECM